MFISKLEDNEDKSLDEKVSALQAAGRPVITVHLKDLLDLGQEFLRWEIATAAAGSVLSINPFDQPNVQESKENTNRLLKQVELTGRLPDDKPALVERALAGFLQLKERLTRKVYSPRFWQRAPGGLCGASSLSD